MRNSSPSKPPEMTVAEGAFFRVEAKRVALDRLGAPPKRRDLLPRLLRPFAFQQVFQGSVRVVISRQRFSYQEPFIAESAQTA
jgi:hypothetical protein